MGSVKLIGFTGPARSGKSTAADEVAGLLNGVHVTRTLYLSAPLKAAAGCLTGHDYTLDLTKLVEVLPGLTGRRLLEILGTDIVRAYDPDHWVKMLGRKADMFSHGVGAEIILVPDVRFPNEAQAVVDSGGFLIECNRPSSLPPGAGGLATHASQARLPNRFHDHTYLLDNTGTLEDLRERLRRLLTGAGLLP